MVEFLARRYGQPISAAFTEQPEAYYVFPSVADLATKATVDELRANGFGYRANFIVDTARALLSRGGNKYLLGLRLVRDRKEIIRELATLPGIGRKVASCIALLSLDCTDQVPVDTHVWQLTLRQYAPQWQNKSLTEKRYDEVGTLFRERFGTHCGWAHQVLFAAELASFQERLPEAMRIERPLTRKRSKTDSPARKQVSPTTKRS
jgi:3-methyladenine DNA glycosylase/8-oxoguanine DNA glycosylase